MRYFIELQYNGKGYCGWQRQLNDKTVQQAIEQALSTLLRQPTEITGAGRTDSGVHSLYYVAHFDIENNDDNSITDVAQLLYKLNIILPHDISIFNITAVEEGAHARFDAIEREYKYYIEQRKNPFTRDISWQYFVPLDIEQMNKAAKILLEVDDFTTFAKLNSNNKTNICNVTLAQWSDDDQGRLCFTIRADRFLRNMVRAIVGTLIDVGRGRYSVTQFQDIVLSRDLSRASGGAQAQGLFLCDITYPQTTFERSFSAQNGPLKPTSKSGK